MKRILLAFALFITSVTVYGEGVKIAFLTDLHIVPGNANDSTMRKIVAEINSSDNQLVVITGDISNQGSDAELSNIKAILGGLTKPYYMVSGNHETTWSESGGKTYQALFGDDRFAFTAGQYLFIGMPCGPYMKMGDGFIKYEDILWAKKTIEQQLKPGMSLVSFAHYPLDEGLSNYRMLLDILKQHQAAAAFCGHGHTCRAYSYEGIPGMMGRALASSDGKTVGYNVICADSDSIILYEKVLGQAPIRRLATAVGASAAALEAGGAAHAVAPVANQALERIYQDDASVFGNVALAGRDVVWANSLGYVKMYRPATGKMRWTRKLDHAIYARPVVADGVVVVGNVDGTVLGLSLRNGRTLWTVTGKGIFVGAPRLDSGYLYVAGSKEYIKVRAADGHVAWRTELPQSYSQGVPAVAGGQVFFGAWDRHLYALNRHTGAPLWSWTNGKSADLLSPGNVCTVAKDGAVYLVAPDRFMTCVAMATGKTLWRNNDYKVRESMGVSADSTTIYAKTMDGWLIAVQPSAEAFSLRWKVDLGLGYEHNPCPIIEHNGIVYIGSRKGEIVAVDAATRTVRWSAKVGFSSVNGFTVAPDGSIWASLIEGSIFRIGTK